MLEPNNLKKGSLFKYQGNPVEAIKTTHTHKARGGATVCVKIKNLITNNVIELTLKSGKKLEPIKLIKQNVTFLYQDDKKVYFMDSKTYEQFSLDKTKFEKKIRFLKENFNICLLKFDDEIIDIELPPKIDLKVIQTEPGIKGNTADGKATKPAKLETNYKLNVPIFIKKNDIVRVNTETGEYVERVK